MISKLVRTFIIVSQELKAAKLAFHKVKSRFMFASYNL